MAIPPGPVRANSPDLLASEKLTVVLEQLRDQAEVVFMDGPPVLTAADSLEVAAEVDGTVLVVAAGRTKIDDVRRAAELLGGGGRHRAGLRRLPDRGALSARAPVARRDVAAVVGRPAPP